MQRCLTFSGLAADRRSDLIGVVLTEDKQHSLLLSQPQVPQKLEETEDAEDYVGEIDSDSDSENEYNEENQSRSRAKKRSRKMSRRTKRNIGTFSPSFCKLHY